jgi:hypothetical protein
MQAHIITMIKQVERQRKNEKKIQNEPEIKKKKSQKETNCWTGTCAVSIYTYILSSE